MSTDIESVGAWLKTAPPGHQARFSQCLSRLLAEGLLWRDEGADLSTYSFLVRHLDQAQCYFSTIGLQLIHHERLHILQLYSDQSALRVQFNKETTLWALLCRLVYAEKKESATLSLTRHPTILSGELYLRYVELFPARNVRKKMASQEALQNLAAAKLIRASRSSLERITEPEVVIELLPTLEVVIPASKLKAISEKLGEFGACLN